MVMVGDDHINACVIGGFDGFDTGGAAVGGDDQIDVPVNGNLANLPTPKPIAFPDSMGNVIGDMCAGVFQKEEQNSRSGDAVHIVIGKDQYFLPWNSVKKNLIFFCLSVQVQK